MSRWRKRKPSSPGNWARSGRMSWRRTSAASLGRTCVSSGASACTAPRWKISPSTAPRSSTARSARRAGRAAPQQRAERRRHLDLAAACRQRQHLGDEQRVPAGSAAIASRRSSGRLRDQRVRVAGQRLEPERDRPSAPRSSSSGRAMHSSRIGAPAESRRDASTRSRKASSPHCRSSKTTTSGACSSSSLRNAHAISSALVAGRSRRAASASRPPRRRPTAARRAA